MADQIVISSRIIGLIEMFKFLAVNYLLYFLNHKYYVCCGVNFSSYKVEDKWVANIHEEDGKMVTVARPFRD